MTGTVFHDTHLPLRKWFMAAYIMCESKKGVRLFDSGDTNGDTESRPRVALLYGVQISKRAGDAAIGVGDTLGEAIL
jgi:hypothetical protein